MTRRLADLRRTPVVVAGLGYGDEAKGATVDALAALLPDTVAVARWSGGAQAAHNVIHGPRHHTFHQFGSATLLDVRTFLLAPMLVDPLLLVAEAHDLAALGVADPLDLVAVDTGCLVTTPLHRAMNRAREIARGADRHGSCGLGIGETVAYDLACRQGARRGDLVGNFAAPGTVVAGATALRAGDLADRRRIVRALDELAAYARPLLESVADPDGALEVGGIHELAAQLHDAGTAVRTTAGPDEAYRALESGTVIFEGSQGVLLDEDHGFHPHTTWATTSPRPLRDRLRAAGFDPFVLGLTRSYTTRHGAGPMPGESADVRIPEPHNVEERFTGAWRQGHLDLAALRYAARVAGGVDAIGLSHLDVFPGRVLTSWGAAADAVLATTVDEPLAARRTRAARDARPQYAECADPAALVARLENTIGAPVQLSADGPERGDRSLR